MSEPTKPVVHGKEYGWYMSDNELDCYYEGWADAEQFSVNKFVNILQSRICFDHVLHNVCEHSACFNNADLVYVLKGKNE